MYEFSYDQPTNTVLISTEQDNGDYYSLIIDADEFSEFISNCKDFQLHIANGLHYFQY